MTKNSYWFLDYFRRIKHKKAANGGNMKEFYTSYLEIVLKLLSSTSTWCPHWIKMDYKHSTRFNLYVIYK